MSAFGRQMPVTRAWRVPKKLEMVFIKAHLPHGSRSNSSSGAAHAGAGSGGDRSSAISRGISANSILGTATSAIWKAT